MSLSRQLPMKIPHKLFIVSNVGPSIGGDKCIRARERLRASAEDGKKADDTGKKRESGVFDDASRGYFSQEGGMERVHLTALSPK